MSSSRRRRPEGIVVRHQRACASVGDARCDCQPGFQAQVFSPRDQKVIRKTFRTLSDARAWRAEAQIALRVGTLRASPRVTVAQAAEAWLAAAKSGVVRTRSGDRYKPSALRGYEQALRGRLLPEFGRVRLTGLTRNAVQDFVDGMVASGASPSTARNAILPLRAIYRRALARSEAQINPTLGLALPAYRGRRERVARPGEARALLEALPVRDRPVWATALYAGLRRGELRALRWQDVDFEAGVIRVERSWDDKVGPVEPKSRAGRRRVPLAAPLRAFLAAHKLAQGPGGRELVFGDGDGKPLAAQWLTERSRSTWADAGLEPIGLHECRHTFAAFMIAAGVNAKALSSYMGHSTITMTLDRYGHLLPGNEDEAGQLLASYLEAEQAKERDAQRPRREVLGAAQAAGR